MSGVKMQNLLLCIIKLITPFIKLRQLGFYNQIGTIISNLERYFIGQINWRCDIAHNIPCQNEMISNIAD